MATPNLSDFFRRLTRGMAVEVLAEDSDLQLVEQALTARNESAFQAIVQRHGAMVYRVCWGVLRHAQDAEDAFQATFLVLARKLRTLRNQSSLASWLHGVAYRCACKAKAQAAARCRREREAALTDTQPPVDGTWAELRAALDFELNRLPDKWRAPLILCYLEARTQDEAARQLRWSKSTLRRRLEEARDALGRRLKGRGMDCSAALSAVLISDCVASAALLPGLVASTVEAASGIGVSGKVMSLAEEVLNTMSATNLTKASWCAAALAACAVVGGLSAAHFLSEKNTTPDSPPSAPGAEGAKAPAAPDLVRKVRESQAWVGRVKSLAAKFETTSSKPGGYSREEGKKVPRETIEIAIDAGRFRRTYAYKGGHEEQRLSLWDGKRATQWWRYAAADRDNVILTAKVDAVGRELWYGTYWLSYQPHAFWWSPPLSKKERNQTLDTDPALLGQPDDFVVAGRADYRGLPCFVLHKKGVSHLRWYVGEKTGLLHGLWVSYLRGNPHRDRLAAEVGRKHGKTFETEAEMWAWIDAVAPTPGEKRTALCLEYYERVHLTDRPEYEIWLSDYKEVKPGCWFPMTQGYSDFRGWCPETRRWRGTYSRPFEERTEVRTVSIRVDEPLPEATFRAPALPDGASVTDRTTDPPRDYTYRTAESENKREKQRKEAIEQGKKEAKQHREKRAGTPVDLRKIDRTIVKEPKYTTTPYYALLAIGPEAKRVWLVVDDKVLYVDRNGNGDLTEPGERVPLDVAATRKIKVGPGAYKGMNVFTMGEVAGVRLHLDVWVRDKDFVPKDDFTRKLLEERQENDWENASLMRVTSAGREEAQNPVTLCRRPKDAQVCHLDGPLTFALKWGDRQALQRDARESIFDVNIGTPGLPTRNSNYPVFAPLTTGEVPADVHPTAHFEFPNKDPDRPPIRLSVWLDRRC